MDRYLGAQARRAGREAFTSLALESGDRLFAVAYRRLPNFEFVPGLGEARSSSSAGPRLVALLLALPLLLLAACGDVELRDSVSASRSTAPSPLDLASLVIPPSEPPDGMTLSDEGGGRSVLQQLPLFPDTASQLEATPGFGDGRWSRFAGSSSEFEASRGFILTWVVEYASEANARSALAILLTELQSDDHYGWGIGEEAGLGDEGTCLDGENPQMGGLQETICVWRRAQVVMVVGGGTFNQTPVQDEAAAMDARAAELLP